VVTRDSGTTAFRAGALGGATVAMLLYALLADAAIESALRGAPARWPVVTIVVGYFALSVVLRRWTGWGLRAGLNIIVMLGLLAATVWTPQGLDHGIAVAGRPTAVVLAGSTALAAALAGVVWARLPRIPVAAKAAAGILAVYAVAAMVLAAASQTSYTDLFHGHGFWERLPSWLQGPILGAGLIGTALLGHLAVGIARIRGSQWRLWAGEALTLGLALVIIVAGLQAPGRISSGGPPMSPGPVATPQPPGSAGSASSVAPLPPPAGGEQPPSTLSAPGTQPSGPPSPPSESASAPPTGPAPTAVPQACLTPPSSSPPVGTTPSPGARITRAVVALDAAGIRPVYAIPATAPAVHALWKVEGVSARDEVQVKWIALKVEGVAPGTVLSTSSAAVDRDAEGAASLVRPAGGWKAGRYRVEIVLRSGAARVAEFVITTPAALRPGVVMRLFADHTYNTMRKTGLARTFALEWSAPPVKPLLESKFWIEWEGLLTPPAPGAYEFLFLGDAVSFLYVDGRLILPHPMQASAEDRTLTLDAAPHTIRLGAVVQVPRGRISLMWKGPGDRDYAPIDARYLGHTAAQRTWKRTSRQAAQAGLEWLQSQSVAWQRTHRCFGCHVQGQVIRGLAAARANDYMVNEEAYQQLIQFTRDRQNSDGSYHNEGQVTATLFAAAGLTAVDDLTHVREDDTVLKALRWLLPRQQPNGEFPIDNVRPPINQGSILTTANSAAAFARAAAETGDPRFRQAADCALQWIASAATVTTQDAALKIMALARLGSPAQRRTAAALAQELVRDQAADGGWKELSTQSGSNAFATGQALCALRDAGVDPGSPPFQRAARFLLAHQEPIGAWPRMNTASESAFVHTMWAAICLAEGPEQVTALPTGRVQVTSVLPRTGPTRRNLEIVLDVSGSMNARLGTSTRWQTALAVLQSVVAGLPDDFNVGLRVYGHRLPSTSPQTCRDTELLVPIVKLDRNRFLSALTSLRPRGETPLVYSALQAAADLKPLGGGFVVLITDGEESCKGDPVKAAAQLKAAGLEVTLNIVGFTLQGKQAERQLATFAQATGGRYYSAQSGSALARALRLATTDRFPYKIFDAGGRLVSQGEAGDLADELPPGRYTVVVQAADEILTAAVTVTADQTAVLSVSLQNDRFALSVP
jgi:hypothetical protein